MSDGIHDIFTAGFFIIKLKYKFNIFACEHRDSLCSATFTIYIEVIEQTYNICHSIPNSYASFFYQFEGLVFQVMKHWTKFNSGIISGNWNSLTFLLAVFFNTGTPFI